MEIKPARKLFFKFDKKRIEKKQEFDLHILGNKEYILYPLEIYDENNVEVAHVTLKEFQIPVLHYEIATIKVTKNRGLSTEKLSGIGGSIVTKINKFLKRKNAIGFLLNSTAYPFLDNKKEVFNMYKNKGWKYVSNLKV